MGLFLFKAVGRQHLSGRMQPRLERMIAAIVVVAGVVVVVAGRLAAAPIERNPTGPTEKGTEKRPPEVLEAIKRFEGGDAEKAFEILKAAAAKYPNLAPARVMFANMYFSDRQKAAGLQQLEIAVSENPDDPEGHIIFGDIAIFERRVSDAEAQYEMAKPLIVKYTADENRKSSLTSQCQLGLANVARLRGKLDQATKLLSKLVESQPTNATAHERLAEALASDGKSDDAFRHLQAAAKANEKLAPPALLMADIYRQLGKSAEASEWLDRALKDSPNDLRVRLTLARWFLDEGQLNKAAEHYAAAEKIDPKSIEVKLGIGTVARYQKENAKARKYLEAVLEQSPSSFAASNQLALLAADEGDPARLAQAFEMAASNLKGAPRSAEAEATLGWVCYKLSKLDEAARHLRAAASSGSLSRDAAYYVAKVAYQSGQRDQAREFLKNAVESRGPFAHADEARQWLSSLSASEAPKK